MINRNIKLLVFTLLIGCDFPSSSPDPEPIIQTEILSVIVSPNPVKVDSLLMLKVIIKDSLDDSFKFKWNLAFQGNTIITNDNYLTVKADTVGTFNNVVTAGRFRNDGSLIVSGNNEEYPDSQEFLISVSQ